MVENEYDQNMTREDLDNLEEAIAEFTSAWQNMINVCNDTSGNCNEIISETLGLKSPMMSWQTTGSLDDVFHDGFQVWLKACNQNILSYRDHHMDSSNAIGAEIHEDDFAEITLDEITEVE